MLKDELILDLKKFFKFFRLSNLFSKFTISRFIFFIISFILFPFVYLFIFLLFVYKYFVKYIFLFLDLIFFSLVSNPVFISYYEKYIYYLKLCTFDIFFRFIPLWTRKLLNYLTKENLKKLRLKMLIYLDTKAYDSFVYLERKIPRWWYSFKKFIFRIMYYFFKYCFFFIKLEGQLFLRKLYRILRRRFYIFIFRITLLYLYSLKYIIYYFFYKFIIIFFKLKQKFVLSINHTFVYKFFKVIILIFYLITSYIFKYIFIIFGY